MYTFTRSLLLIITISIGMLYTNAAYARHNCTHQNCHELTLPQTMMRIQDTAASADGDQMYYDTTANMVLIISERKSHYKSVNQYIDCSQRDLEQVLRASYEDSTLRLLDCRKTVFAVGKSSTVIHFRITDGTAGLNTYMVYFIHYRKKDIQVSFTYKKEAEQKDIAYIDKIMSRVDEEEKAPW